MRADGGTPPPSAGAPGALPGVLCVLGIFAAFHITSIFLTHHDSPHLPHTRRAATDPLPQRTHSSTPPLAQEQRTAAVEAAATVAATGVAAAGGGAASAAGEATTCTVLEHTELAGDVVKWARSRQPPPLSPTGTAAQRRR